MHVRTLSLSVIWLFLGALIVSALTISVVSHYDREYVYRNASQREVLKLHSSAARSPAVIAAWFGVDDEADARLLAKNEASMLPSVRMIDEGLFTLVGFALALALVLSVAILEFVGKTKKEPQLDLSLRDI